MDPVSERRLRRASIPTSLLERLFMSKVWVRVDADIPHDMTIVAVNWSHERHAFEVTLASPTFDVVSEGSEVPRDELFEAFFIEQRPNGGTEWTGFRYTPSEIGGTDIEVVRLRECES